MSAVVGHIILAHENIEQTRKLINHLAASGAPVVVHIDRCVKAREYRDLVKRLAHRKHVHFSRRYRCEWGRMSLVRATIAAARKMLALYPDIQHVMLNSGSSLPSRSLSGLHQFLRQNATTDFIESTKVGQSKWVLDGLEEERFTLYFPFSWRQQRYLFDRFVDAQRWLKVERRLPAGLQPHLGSQWWCLTSKTLRAILDDPKLPRFRRFFWMSWIPDESFFQSLARNHSANIESRSLTWSRFDHFGKPVTLYDDHFEAIRATDVFFARKIWPGATKLYERLLDKDGPRNMRENDQDLYSLTEHVLSPKNSHAAQRKNMGRYPTYRGRFVDNTSAEFGIMIGLKSAFPKLQEKLSRDGIRAHGSLFHTREVQFAGGKKFDRGNLPAIPEVRNRDPMDFVANLIANSPDQFHLFFYDAWDLQRARSSLLRDPNARLLFGEHGWVFESFARSQKKPVTRSVARQLYEGEQRILRAMQNDKTAAQIDKINLLEMIHEPKKLAKSVNVKFGATLSARDVTVGKAERMALDAHITELQKLGFKLPNVVVETKS